MHYKAEAFSVILVFVLAFPVFADNKWHQAGGVTTDTRTVLIHPHQPRIIYSGSKGAILKSKDSGASWRNILFLRSNTVNFLVFSPQDPDFLYAATANGLYCSVDAGEHWKRIFRGRNYLEADCGSVAVSADAIYLGTQAGLFISRDKARTWQRCAGEIGRGPVLSVTYNPADPGYIYAAALGGVFKSQDAGFTWEKVFTDSPSGGGSDSEESIDGNEEDKRFSGIRYLAVDHANAGRLYLATSRGVYKSSDYGLSWEPLSNYGLLNREVKFLSVFNDGCLYASGKSGIFKYAGLRWEEISFGLAAEDFRFLASDKEGNLYAACDKGLFKTSIQACANMPGGGIIGLYEEGQPGIAAVQEAAVKYAEVEPEKIIRWRNLAAKRAALPKVSAGINRDTTDLWHWESGSTTKNGDDVLVRGRDTIGWDLTLSWDLSELIWSSEQTSIDVRSRLMVELRGDILDEVNKTYFERLRVKMELDSLPIEDRNKRAEKDLRLRELTASLDALTGGFFSRKIRDLASGLRS